MLSAEIISVNPLFIAGKFTINYLSLSGPRGYCQNAEINDTASTRHTVTLGCQQDRRWFPGDVLYLKVMDDRTFHRSW